MEKEMMEAMKSELIDWHIKSALSSTEFGISTISFIHIDEDDIRSVGVEFLTSELLLIKERLEKARDLVEEWKE